MSTFDWVFDIVVLCVFVYLCFSSDNILIKDNRGRVKISFKESDSALAAVLLVIAIIVKAIFHYCC